jgi:hypothetical protein
VCLEYILLHVEAEAQQKGPLRDSRLISTMISIFDRYIKYIRAPYKLFATCAGWEKSGVPLRSVTRNLCQPFFAGSALECIC